MATMTYQQWLAARSRRAGHPVTSSKAEAAAFKTWQSQQPEYIAQQKAMTGPLPSEAPSGPNTAVDPNDLWNAILKDPQALTDAASAQRDYSTSGATALANWQTARNQLAAQLPQYQHQLDLGLLNSARTGAARGTFASGQTEVDKQQNRTDYANQVAQNQLQAQQADNEYQAAAGQAASDFNQRYYGAFKDAASRYTTDRLGNFNDTYGINSGLGAQTPNADAYKQLPPTTAPTVAKPPTATTPATPNPTWAQFVASHGSPTGTARTRLSTIYKKRFA